MLHLQTTDFLLLYFPSAHDCNFQRRHDHAGAL